jgi:hypothetical protein
MHSTLTHVPRSNSIEETWPVVRRVIAQRPAAVITPASSTSRRGNTPPLHARAAPIDQIQQHDDEKYTGNNSNNRYIVHVNFSFFFIG